MNTVAEALSRLVKSKVHAALEKGRSSLLGRCEFWTSSKL